ncbi:hypothetical protein F5984_08840 [Rudanella paleaurantiibacter]|uniref:Uncharacterized protein n=1 Tax=Rudanella paleaurantiibacter TaxID=2614655 RepID=A0A7J5TZT8_9BACT|nr:hypothetical protein [Rudanella paleaurantiibacter]KAB7730929.1 hypothetical protein F5984_08840 [Rudanella paleaurantiibacter]
MPVPAPSRFLCLSLLTIALCSSYSFGQSQPSQDRFPTYDHIKPNPNEIYDYVNPDRSIPRQSKAVFNLFSYPEGTTTYKLNGQIYKSTEQAKRAFLQKGRQIEQFTVGKPDTDGKRLIEITYR